MPRAHYIVLRNPDGSPKLAPMRAWLRENPQEVPEGLDQTTCTSHQLRRALSRNGWELEELHDRILLIKPDESGDTTFATAYCKTRLQKNKSQKPQRSLLALSVICNQQFEPTLVTWSLG